MIKGYRQAPLQNFEHSCITGIAGKTDDNGYCESCRATLLTVVPDNPPTRWPNAGEDGGAEL